MGDENNLQPIQSKPKYACMIATLKQIQVKWYFFSSGVFQSGEIGYHFPWVCRRIDHQLIGIR